VARYTKEHKQVTRQRIIEKAGHRFKQDGTAGSGISTLMADAGLTNGAFYAHFASKDDLIANVVADQLRTQVERHDTLRPGRQGLEDFVRGYLSPEHRDQPSTGCHRGRDRRPSGARGSAVRSRQGHRAFHHDGGDPATVPRPRRPYEVLEQGIENAYTFMR
jgi:AcrR family transcriptional regulator